MVVPISLILFFSTLHLFVSAFFLLFLFHLLLSLVFVCSAPTRQAFSSCVFLLLLFIMLSLFCSSPLLHRSVSACFSSLSTAVLVRLLPSLPLVSLCPVFSFSLYYHAFPLLFVPYSPSLCPYSLPFSLRHFVILQCVPPSLLVRQSCLVMPPPAC